MPPFPGVPAVHELVNGNKREDRVREFTLDRETMYTVRVYLLVCSWTSAMSLTISFSESGKPRYRRTAVKDETCHENKNISILI
jgi:hypothetical protein